MIRGGKGGDEAERKGFVAGRHPQLQPVVEPDRLGPRGAAEMDVPPRRAAAIGDQQRVAKRDIGKAGKPVDRRTGGGSERGG